jgi:hypothetical protein
VYDLGWAGRRWNVAILFRKSYCTTGRAHKHFSSTCVVCCPELKLPTERAEEVVEARSRAGGDESATTRINEGD